MAKKTNYLTELIERHERWRAEGGERVEEDDRRVVEEECVSTMTFSFRARSLYIYSASGDPEDLWDFGTVRHVGTVGRAKQSQVQVSGPPLTWENNGSVRSDGSSSSGRHSFNHKQRLQSPSYTGSVTAKGDLPPLPGSPSTPKKHDFQGTVRQSGNGLSREPSEEYDDDFEDEDDIHNAPPPSDDDLPDTTMLDSVVLPAIASVRAFFFLRLLNM